MTFDWTSGKLAEGRRHYDAGQFFAAHEAWESVWLEASGAEKRFLQALIQVAAAFHHYQRSNAKGTALLLRAALSRLESCPTRFGGISVSLLRDDIRQCLQVLECGFSTVELGPPRMCLFSD